MISWVINDWERDWNPTKFVVCSIEVSKSSSGNSSSKLPKWIGEAYNIERESVLFKFIGLRRLRRWSWRGRRVLETNRHTLRGRNEFLCKTCCVCFMVESFFLHSVSEQKFPHFSSAAINSVELTSSAHKRCCLLSHLSVADFHRWHSTRPCQPPTLNSLLIKLSGKKLCNCFNFVSILFSAFF